MRERIKIAKQQEKKDLKNEIKDNFKEVKFNNDGTIKNYEAVLEKYYKKYANKKQSAESQEKNKEKYDKLKELLDEYETLILETIPEWEAEIRAKIDEKYENMVQSLEYEIELKVRFGESSREYKEFLHEIGKYTNDYIANSKFQENLAQTFIDSGELVKQTTELDNALKELNTINKAIKNKKDITKEKDEKYFSKVWGDNKEGLMEYIATLQSDLMGSLETIYAAREEAQANYIDALEESIDKMDEHLAQYDELNDELEHRRNLIELIYGEESEKLGNLYEGQHQLNIEKMKGLNSALDGERERLANIEKEMAKEGKKNVKNDNGSITYTDRYKELEAEKEIVSDHIDDLLQQLKDTTINSVENLLAQFDYIINQSFLKIDKAFLNGKGLSEAQDQWDLINKKSDQYLDSTNKAFEARKLESKFIDALNKTDSLKAQKKLNTVMEEQLAILEKEGDVSQYQVDRANLIYDLTLKQIALEEAQQNKSKMRLRRDAQGNYSYQFTADANLIKQTQQELLDVQQQLYNLDKDEYKNQLSAMAGYYEEWQEKLKELSKIADETERNRRIEETNKYYNDLIQKSAKESQLVKENLDGLVNGPLADFYEENKQITIGEDGISGMYTSAFSTMAEKFVGEEGFATVSKKAFDDIKTAAGAYQTKLGEIEEQTDLTFAQLEDVSDITGKIGEITTATDSLKEAWRLTLESLKGFVTTLTTFLSKPEVQNALKSLGNSEKKEQTELNIGEGQKGGEGSTGGGGNNTGGGNKSGGSGGGYGQAGHSGGLTEEESIKLKVEDLRVANKKKIKSKDKKITLGEKVKVKSKYAKNKGGKFNQKEYVGKQVYVVSKSGSWYELVSSDKKKIVGWTKKSRLSGFDTGGYTGVWNSNQGKLAMLHEKELVLNKQDTRNILDAVNIIRSLSGVLQSSMVDRIAGLTQSLNTLSLPAVSNTTTTPQAIEQTVHITAEFPGATEAIQIEQALQSLVSRATQHAFRLRE